MNSVNLTSDPNAPYREAIQALADGYGYVPRRQDTNSPSSDDPQIDTTLAGLKHLSVASSSSATRLVTVDEIREEFRQIGIEYDKRSGCKDTTVMARLADVALSLESLQTTIAIAKSSWHPLKQELGVQKKHCDLIIAELSRVISSRGWGRETIRVIQESSDDPSVLFQKIHNVYRHL